MPMPFLFKTAQEGANDDWFHLLSPVMSTNSNRPTGIYAFFIRKPAQGLVPKVPYFWTSNDQIAILNVP